MPQSSGLPTERTKKLEPSKGRAWSRSQAAFAHPIGCKGFALQGQGMTVATREKEFSQDHTKNRRARCRSNPKAGCRKQWEKKKDFQRFLKGGNKSS